MTKQNPTSLSPLTWFGTILITAVALGWSIGLIGKGIWELGWTFASQSNQTLSKIPDSFAQVPNVKYFNTTTEALRRLAEDFQGIYYGSASAILPQCSIKPLPLGQQPDRFIAPYHKPLVSSEQCPNLRNRIDTKAFQTATYPLTHYLYVVIKENGDIEEQVGQAYANFLLTPEGQRLIAKAGFIPLR